MAATLENISQLERRLNISLPSQEIDSEVQTRLKQLARNVKMHGFRPGKVPLKVVAQQYEDQVRREVLGDALQKSFGDAVRAQNLKVAGYPRFVPQGELGSALSRLMVVSEQYPNLKANQGFADLRVTLEGTENRITVARGRYIKTVEEYNVLARSFPSNLTAMVFSYQPKPTFSVANEAQISTPPTVDFNKK